MHGPWAAWILGCMHGPWAAWILDVQISAGLSMLDDDIFCYAAVSCAAWRMSQFALLKVLQTNILPILHDFHAAFPRVCLKNNLKCLLQRCCMRQAPVCAAGSAADQHLANTARLPCSFSMLIITKQSEMAASALLHETGACSRCEKCCR